MIHLFDLPSEILVNIITFLPTKDVLKLSICSKQFHDILYLARFTNEVPYDKISKLSYFDSFENVFYNNTNKSENDSLKTSFPKSIKTLHWSRNSEIPEEVSEKILILKLGTYYWHSLLKIPGNLEHFYLGVFFDNPLPSFPASLKRLILSWSYNQVLPLLPDALEYLELGHWYKHPLKQLPGALKSLVLGNHFNHELPQLPETLECLELGIRFNHDITHLPTSLKYLTHWNRYKHYLPIIFKSSDCTEREEYRTGMMASSNIILKFEICWLHDQFIIMNVDLSRGYAF